jgi:Fur family ferric uptake transcriptional regulator
MSQKIMESEDELMIKFVDLYEKTLKENGYKLTNQRRVVLETLYNRVGEHLTAEEVHQLVKMINPEIGLATVYRTLQLLSELGLIDKLNLDDGVVRYEIGEMDTKHRHHHLICEECGTIMGVDDDMLDALEEAFSKKYGFKVTDHVVKFYGVCKSCLQKQG